MMTPRPFINPSELLFIHQHFLFSISHKYGQDPIFKVNYSAHTVLIIYHKIFLYMDYEALKFLISKKSRQWTNTDVEKWLKFIHLPQLIPIFRQLSIDGSCINQLNDVDLREELNIKSNIVFKKLKKWIQVGLIQYDTLLERSPVVEYDDYESETSTSEIEVIIETQPHPSQNRVRSWNKIEKCRTSQKQKRIFLVIKRTSDIETTLYRFMEKNCRIGRNYNCDIIVEEQRVQRFHTLIRFQYPNYFLTDISKRSGTLVKIHNQIKLRKVSIVEMGNNLFKIQINYDEETLLISTVYGVNPGEKFEFPASKTKITIGRRINHDINFVNDITLSNYHAKLTKINGNWYLQDLQTTNGTWIVIQEEQQITNQLTFKLGATNYIYQCFLQIEGEPMKRTSNSKVEESDLTSKFMCYMCNQEQRNIIFWPCKHCIACNKCAESIETCEMCLQQVIDTTKIFRG